jgi:hypothetical protein
MEEVAYLTVAFEHADAVEPRHRFPEIVFRGETWDLRHLDAFALRMDPDLGFEVDVVVLFTCHCFTHSIKRDVRAPLEISPEGIYEDNVERRVLSKERYDLSRRFLPGLVKDLPRRTIRYAGDDSLNYFTAEKDVSGVMTHQGKTRARKDNGHQWWPSHARLSIAFCANSHSRWDPAFRAALPFTLAHSRSCLRV